MRQDHSPGPHLVLFDGTCVLCDGFVRFVLKRDRRGQFHFAELQGVGAVKHSGVGAADGFARTMHVLTDYRRGGGRHLVRGRAVLYLLWELGWPYRALCVVGVLPTAWLDAMYDGVAANRHRLFGRREECGYVGVEFRDRFPEPGEVKAVLEGNLAPRGPEC